MRALLCSVNVTVLCANNFYENFSCMNKKALRLSLLSQALIFTTSSIVASSALADDTLNLELQEALNADYMDSAIQDQTSNEDANDGGNEVYDLGQTVVSASGFAQDLKEAPASMSVIDGDTVRATAARDIGDIVANLPGIEIAKSKTGNSNIMMRGFSSDYTAFLIDGKRQNSSTAFVKNGFDPNMGYTPPASMIERIEIIRGPASTLYGSDAVGGVINIITKKHPEKVTGSIGFETLMQQHEKFGNAAGTNANINVPLIDDKLSVQFRGRYYEKDHTDIKAPNGKYLAHSANDFDLKNYGAKVIYSPVKGHDISIDGEQYYMKAGSMSTSSAGIAVLNEYRKDQLVLNYDGQYDFGSINSYAQYINHTRNDVDYQFYSRSYILETKAITPFAFNNGQALNLTTGLQWWRDEFRDDATLANAVKDDLGGNTLVHNLTSAYLEGEYFLSNDWIATVGGRFSHSDHFGNHFTPRGYLVYKATNNLTLKGGVAAGYKTPSIKELTDGVYNQNNSGANPIYGTPDLKPETSINYELSVMYELPKVGSFTLTGFLTDFENKLGNVDYAVGTTMDNGIVCNPTVSAADSKCSLRSNKGKTRSQGVELLFSSARFNNFKLEGSYTYTHHTYRDGVDAGKFVNAIPAHAIMAKLSYDKDNYGLFIKGVGKIRTPYIATRGGAGFDYYKNYMLLDLGGHYNFTPQARLNITINNLLDFDAYEDFDAVAGSRGTTYNSYYRDYIEGRSVYASMTYDF